MSRECEREGGGGDGLAVGSVWRFEIRFVVEGTVGR